MDSNGHIHMQSSDWQLILFNIRQENNHFLIKGNLIFLGEQIPVSLNVL